MYLKEFEEYAKKHFDDEAEFVNMLSNFLHLKVENLYSKSFDFPVSFKHSISTFIIDEAKKLSKTTRVKYNASSIDTLGEDNAPRNSTRIVLFDIDESLFRIIFRSYSNSTSVAIMGDTKNKRFMQLAKDLEDMVVQKYNASDVTGYDGNGMFTTIGTCYEESVAMPPLANYPFKWAEEFVDVEDMLRKFEQGPEQLMFLIGIEGSGKTELARWFIENTASVFRITICNEDIVKSSNLFRAMSQYHDALFIIDDINHSLDQEEHAESPLISALLSETSNMRRTGNKYIIISNKQSTSKFPSKLLRPGRCFRKPFVFGNIKSKDFESVAIANGVAIPDTDKHELTLSQIIHKDYERRKDSIGFLP